MPTLSIVIVNYNVKYFIRQCIQSILKSDFSDTYEIIVVDNNSSDDSLTMLQQEFGNKIVLKANTENLGFSKANNQGFKLAQGKYVLILNPDTIVEEHTLQVCYDHLENEKEVGAIGVKMFDGAGNYLPESKRGFPKPLSAFFKLSGLSKLFKKSAFFNQYYLGHLSNDRFHEVDVLTGAFLFTRKEILDKIGGFDEDYFMYGEDIEMSFQIKEAGFKIMYVPSTSIIHFKGESTKKSSIDYLKNFYGAMGIYAGKRNKGAGGIWNVILQLGILFTASVSVFKRLAVTLLRPAFDILTLFLSTRLIKKLWAQFYHQDASYFDNAGSDLTAVILVFILILIYALFGQYDKRHNIKHLLYSFVFGSLAILSVYSLFPSEMRFSRIVLLVMAVATPIILFITRKVYNKVLFKTWSFDALVSKRVAVIGLQDSCEKIGKIVNTHSEKSELVGYVSNAEDYNSKETERLGPQEDIKSIVESRDVNELIFCSKDLTTQYIFNAISQLGNQISYKIANNDNTSILGSDSKDRVGEWYTLDIGFKIDQAFHRRTKRMIDVFIAIASLVFFPIVLLFSKARAKVFSNIFSVFFGQKTWMGYKLPDADANELPKIKPSVFNAGDIQTIGNDIHSGNLYYARKYSVWLELEFLLKAFFKS